MWNLNNAITSAYATSLNTAALPKYNTSIVADLPADAAPQGILADGTIYEKPYEMLTASDQVFLKAVTGQSFDKATIAAEEAAGTFTGNGLAAAIGMDRANGFLTGDIDTAYLTYMKNQVNDPKNLDGSFEGVTVSRSEVNAAFSALASESSPSVNLSA